MNSNLPSYWKNTCCGARLPSRLGAFRLRSSPCVAKHLRVARLAAVARAGRLDRRAVRRQLVLAHVTPAAARLPLNRQVGLGAERARRPRHVGGRAGPPLAEAAWQVGGARLARVEHFLPVLGPIGAALPEGRRGGGAVLGRFLVPQPALAKGVVPTGVEPPADRRVAKRPAVARVVLAALAGVNTAPVAALLRGGGPMTDAKSEGLASTVRVGLLAARIARGDARAVGHAGGLALGVAVAYTVATAALLSWRLARVGDSSKLVKFI